MPLKSLNSTFRGQSATRVWHEKTEMPINVLIVSTMSCQCIMEYSKPKPIADSTGVLKRNKVIRLFGLNAGHMVSQIIIRAKCRYFPASMTTFFEQNALIIGHASNAKPQCLFVIWCVFFDRRGNEEWHGCPNILNMYSVSDPSTYILTN